MRNYEYEKRGDMKRITFLFMFVASLLLAVGVVASGCGGSGGSSEAPNVLVDKAIQKNPDVKSGHIDYTINIEGAGDLSSLSGSSGGGSTSFKIGMTGGADFDNSNQAAPKAKGTITFTGLTDLINQMSQSSGSTAGLDLSSMSEQISSFLKDMEFVAVDNKVYLKLAGTWYDLGDASSASSDLSGLGALGGATGMGGISSLGTTTDADTQCFENAMKDSSKFGSDKLFKNLTTVGSEKIDGTDTTHIKADVDLAKTVQTISDISKSCGQAEASGGLEGGSAQISKLFKTLTVEMWIDNDNMTRQVKITMEVDPAAVSDVASGLGGSLGTDTTSATPGLESLKIDVSVKLSKVGEQFDIQKPSGQISKIEDLMGGLLGSSLGDTSGLGGLGGLGGTSTDSGSSDSGFSTDVPTPSY